MKYEIWTDEGLIEEFYNYNQFKKEILRIAKERPDTRGYGFSTIEIDSRYYKVRDGKLTTESNCLNN